MAEGVKYIAHNSYGFNESFDTRTQAVDSLHALHKFTSRHLRLLQAGESVSRGNLQAWVEKVRKTREVERMEELVEAVDILRGSVSHSLSDADIFHIFYEREDPCTIAPISSPVEGESSSLETPLNPSET